MCLIIMRTLALLYLVSSLSFTLTFGATENKPKSVADSSQKNNQEKGPNFNKLSVEGVSKEEITAFTLAWRKANQSDQVIAARERLTTARQRLQEAAGGEKKDALSAVRTGTDELRIEIRKAIQIADPKLKIETIEKLMDAVEEQIKARIQEKKNS